MCSTIFILLALCSVAFSSEMVSVHVTDVADGYNILELKGEGENIKRFILGTLDTDSSHVKVTNKIIKEDALNVGFTATSAAILGVTLPKMTIKKDDTSGCAKGQTCFKPSDSGCDIHIQTVNSKQKTVTCKAEGADKVLLLSRVPNDSNENIIQVDGTSASKTGIAMCAKATACEIDEAAVLDTIELKTADDCSATKPNCFKNGATFLNTFKLSLLAACLILGKML